MKIKDKPTFVWASGFPGAFVTVLVRGWAWELREGMAVAGRVLG